MAKEDPFHTLARALGTIRSRDEVARELIDIVEELLYGDHIWCYEAYLGGEVDDEEAESTTELISNAEDVLKRARKLFLVRRRDTPKVGENRQGGT